MTAIDLFIWKEFWLLLLFLGEEGEGFKGGFINRLSDEGSTNCVDRLDQ